jgi:pyruvate dehydrogenase E1 component alpha subunit
MQAGTRLTASDLIAFETEVATIFNSGAIRAPVHLSSGNEEQLINIFKDVDPNDWVFSTWRSHYHALLHGIPRDKLMEAIRAGRSISLNFPEHNFYSSAIVGGMLPIAVGVAWGLRYKTTGNVWVFIGDMATQSGMFDECVRYSLGHNLPITFVTEDNGLSVCTDTKSTQVDNFIGPNTNSTERRIYSYHLTYPHSGAGKRVEF